MSIYKDILSAKQKNQKKFVVLIDPDKSHKDGLDKLLRMSNDAHVDYFFIGGSLLMNNKLDHFISEIKSRSDIPCILFPGNGFQISAYADAILYLSLISGRNPDLLIGKHVETAAHIRETKLEVISTGYMLIDGGKNTAVNYMSHTQPIPSDKNSIAAATAIAGEMLGMKMIYLEAGSGAMTPVSTSMISHVRKHVNIPIIVGGGISTPEKAQKNLEAGADIIVVGNAIEKDPELLIDLSAAIHSSKTISL